MPSGLPMPGQGSKTHGRASGGLLECKNPLRQSEAGLLSSLAGSVIACRKGRKDRQAVSAPDPGQGNRGQIERPLFAIGVCRGD